MSFFQETKNDIGRTLDLLFLYHVSRKLQYYDGDYDTHRPGTLFQTMQIQALSAITIITGKSIGDILKLYCIPAGYQMIIQNLSYRNERFNDDSVSQWKSYTDTPECKLSDIIFDRHNDYSIPYNPDRTAQIIKNGSLFIKMPQGFLYSNHYRDHGGFYVIYDSYNNLISKPVTRVLSVPDENKPEEEQIIIIYPEIDLCTQWLDILRKRPAIIKNAIQADAIKQYSRVRKWMFRRTVNEILIELVGIHKRAEKKNRFFAKEI